MEHTASQPAVPAQSPPTEPAPPPTDEPRGATRAQLDVTELHAALTAAVRHGARGARIARHAPQLVKILYPDGTLDAQHLAAVKDVIRAALDSIGGTDAAALSALIGLTPGTLGRSLTDRRAIAARALGIEPDTLRRTHQRALIWDLAMEIYEQRPRE